MASISFEKCAECTPSKCPQPRIQTNHVDGPCFIWCSGHMRWLTLGERIKLFFGRLDMKKVRP